MRDTPTGSPRTARPNTMAPGTRLLTVGVFVLAAVILALAYWLHVAGRGGGGGRDGENEFAYDVKGLMKVDPALVIYEEAKEFDTGLEEPRGIDTSTDDSIYIVGDSDLRVFDSDGRALSELKLQGEPKCLDVTHGGLYYIGFKDHVETYDSKTKARMAAWDSLGEAAFLTSIAVAKSEAYLADSGQRVVWRCEIASGKTIGEIGRQDEERNIPGLFVPSPHLDLLMAPDGLLRVANTGRHSIEAYTVEGDLELQWGKFSMGIEGFSGCCNPCSFALTPDGEFVTCEKGIPRVKLYNAQGAFIGVVAGPDRFAEGKRALREGLQQGSGGGLDVAVDSRRRVLVLDPLARKVIVFAKNIEKTEKVMKEMMKKKMMERS